MKIACDLDGTLDSSPAIRELMKKLHKHGHKVTVLSGSHVLPVTKAEKKMKKEKLAGLGMKGHYDKLKVFPNPPGKAKAAYCEKHNVAVLLDNSAGTAQIMHGSPTTVLVPWKTISPD